MCDVLILHYANNILLRATFHRAPSYGGVRTLVEDLLARRTRAVAEASNLRGERTGFYTCTYVFPPRVPNGIQALAAFRVKTLPRSQVLATNMRKPILQFPLRNTFA